MKAHDLLCVLTSAYTAFAVSINVSPSGNDASGDGTSGAPYLTITAAVGFAQSGDTIYIRNGTYREAIVIPASLSGDAEKPTVMRGESRDGAIIDGEFQRGYLFTSQAAEYFHLENLTFRNARWPYWNRGAVQPAAEGLSSDIKLKGWKVEDIVVEKSEGIGLSMSKTQEAVVKNCILQDNFQLGLSGSMSNALRVIGCTICRNDAGWSYNPWQDWINQGHEPENVSLDPQDGKYYVSAAFGTGGAKIIPADGTIFENCIVFGNSGPGIWFDGSCTNVTVRNCVVYSQFNHAHNQYNNNRLGGTGIMFESAPTGPFLVEGCYIYNNECEDINICEASNGIVRNNTILGVVGGDGKGQGRFTLRDGWSPGGRQPIRNIIVENNLFQNMWIESRRGGPDNWTAETLSNRNIAFNNNRWEGTEPMILEWENRPRKEIFGLENMRSAWGTFLTDTYQLEVTANREAFPPICRRGRQSNMQISAPPSFLFDLRGRCMSSSAFPSALWDILIDGNGLQRRIFMTYRK